MSEPDRVSGLDRARTHQGRVENEQEGAADRAGQIEGLKYPTNTDRESSGYRVWNVTRCVPVKLGWCDCMVQKFTVTAVTLLLRFKAATPLLRMPQLLGADLPLLEVAISLEADAPPSRASGLLGAHTPPLGIGLPR